MNGYLISLQKNNYESIRNSGYSIVGFTKRCHMVDDINPGDMLIIYVASHISKIAGILKVEEKVYWDTELIWEDVFPKRIKTSPYAILPTNDWIDFRAIKDDIEFISNKKTPKFGVYLMQGIRKLSRHDYEYLLYLIKKEMEDGIKGHNI